MSISIIAAVSENWAIGLNNQLPWHLPADLDYFRNNVKGKVVIGGRKTFDSIGVSFPNSKNIILSREDSYPSYIDPNNTKIAKSLEEALRLADNEDIMIIGGADVYQQTLAIADFLYLTFIHTSFQGDSFFPKIDFNEWQKIFFESHQPDAQNPYYYDYTIWQRNAA